MMRAFFCVFLCWIAAPALSETFPAFFDVSGVETNDMLNVRAKPNISASIVSKLEHNDRRIEVVGQDESGNWGQINVGESTGWVSLQFMSRLAGQAEDTLPRPLRCIGNEPFWSLDIDQSQIALLSRPSADPIRVTMLEPVTASNRNDRYAIFGQSDDSVFTFIFHRDQCSDGSSDRAYGVSVDLFLTETSGVNYVTGCCNLAN